MDNLSHSLIGLIAGEAVARTTRAREPGLSQQTWRGLLVTLSVVGGNLPDLDLIYSYRGFSNDPRSKLDYMLQHRGYTHTILGCVILALLLYAAVEVWARWRRVALSPQDRGALASMACFGVLLHLATDFLNSYGVHPFWPLQNRWYYGDSVFIVEPLYWAAAAPLLFVVRSGLARVVLALSLAAAVVLCLLSERVTPGWCVGLGVLMLVLLVLGARASAGAAAITSAAVMLAVTVMFLVAGGAAARRVDAIAAADFPGGDLLDHVLSPAPMNPLCWDVLLLEMSGDRYTVREGVLSTLPAVMPAKRCPRMSDGRPMTVLAQPPAGSGEVRWLGEFTMSRALLVELVASHCDAAALMQFVRAPFATWQRRGWIMGDLRFAGERGGGMATLVLGAPSRAECRRSVPWVFPRADLLHQDDGTEKKEMK